MPAGLENGTEGLAGVRLATTNNRLRTSLCNDPAPSFAAFGTEIDDPIRALYDIEVVLDDEDSIAHIYKAMQDIEQTAYIFEMEARRGLVENVERTASRPLRKLFRELDPLSLTARERRCGLTELDVAKAHIDKCLELALDLRNVLEKPSRLLDCHVEQVRDRLPLVTHCERFTVVARSATHVARARTRREGSSSRFA